MTVPQYESNEDGDKRNVDERFLGEAEQKNDNGGPDNIELFLY